MTDLYKFWCNTIGEGWTNNLKNVFCSNFMNKLIKFLMEEYTTSRIFPYQKDIFKPFKLCKYEDLKVIIIGEEPYNSNIGTGLAFANKSDTLIPDVSLARISEAVEANYEHILNIGFDITLESWAKQGVLLLNSSLTVKQYDPASHQKMWGIFMKVFIKELAASCTGLHFVFWGNSNRFKSLIDEKLHFVYEYEYPKDIKMNSWKCDHFNKINENIILQNGETEIIAW